jgi:alpha-galactosidase
LHDISPTNAERIGSFARKLASQLEVGACIVTETDPDRAMTGADFVIITISTGGLDAMAHDLAIPEEYGIYHTVGDTMGPGGWARTLRNTPIFVDLAERVNRLAPRAVILNYTNPMAQLTKVLCLRTQRPVVGLCHGLFENLRVLQKMFGLDSEDDVQCTYAGVNHFFWMTSLSFAGQDGYPALRKRLRKQSLPELRAEMDPDKVASYVADELYRFTGVLPYMADRHTSEFFGPYITSEKNLERYRLRRTTVQERKESMRKREDQVEKLTVEGIPPSYGKRSRETAADIINALVTGRSFIDVGNVPNVGQVPNLPLGSVLETPVLIRSTGFHPIAVGGLPEPICTWVSRVAVAQDLMVESAMEADLDKAFAALALDPVVSHLNLHDVKSLGRKLLRAHSEYLPQFGGSLEG